jgi:hypothetical protein
MVPVTALLLPIVMATVIVFLASFILHMVLPLHRSDFKKVPREDDVMDALRPFDIPPGDYAMPLAAGMSEMSSPAFKAKYDRGPVAFMTVSTGAPLSMSGSLVKWFVYCVLVSVFAAYLAGAALPVGAHYLEVFRFAGTTAFCCYAVGLWQMSIWYRRSWVTTAKATIDGLIYALLTAGTMGWLWPR